MSKSTRSVTIIDYNDTLAAAGYIGKPAAKKPRCITPTTAVIPPTGKRKNFRSDTQSVCYQHHHRPDHFHMSPRSSGMWATMAPPSPQVRTTLSVVPKSTSHR